jgi:Apea-like HEPN
MNELIESFKILGQKILELKSPKNGHSFVEKQHEIKWKIDGITHSENGIAIEKCVSKESYVNNWVRFRLHLQNFLPNLEIYKKCISDITSAFPDFANPEAATRFFVDYIYNNYISEEIDSDYSIFVEEVIDQLIKNLNEDPIECTARVYLEGLTLESASIQLSPNITLRQSTKDDLESGMMLQLTPHHGIDILRIATMLDIKLNLRLNDVNQLQAKVHQQISILRLFGVGAIRYYVFKSDSKSVLLNGFPRGFMVNHMMPISDIKYRVEKNLEPKLKAFCAHLENIMPVDLYDLMGKKTDYLKIAYDRYSEGILEQVILERRILHISMGLEALFSNSDTELSFKLTLRISKALSCLGKNPLEVRRFVKEAYAIRSSFAHGSPLLPKQQKKLDDLGGAKLFLLTMVDYLRILLLASMICKLNKTKLIELIDDSFLDAQKEIELKKLFSAALPYI